MLVKVEGLVIGGTEDERRFFVQQAAGSEFIHVGRPGVGGAALEQKIRPQPRFLDQCALDKGLRPLIGHSEEGANEVAVIGEDGGV